MKVRNKALIIVIGMLLANTAWSDDIEDVGMQVTDNPNANAEQAYRVLSLPEKASSTAVEHSAAGLEKANDVRSNRGHEMNEHALEGLQKAEDAKSNAADKAADGVTQAQDSAASQAQEALQSAQEAQQNGLNTAGENRP